MQQNPIKHIPVNFMISPIGRRPGRHVALSVDSDHANGVVVLHSHVVVDLGFSWAILGQSAEVIVVVVFDWGIGATGFAGVWIHILKIKTISTSI